MEKPITTRKICFVITKANFGGAQKYVYDLASAYANGKDFTVSVIIGGEGKLVELLREENIPVRIIPSLQRDINPLKEIKAFFELMKVLNEEKPDIIHINSSKIAVMGSIAGILLNIQRIVFTIHGWPFNEERPWLIRKIFWFGMIIPVLFSDRVIAVSEAVRKQTPLFSIFHKKVKTIYLGVDKKEISENDRALMLSKLEMHEKPHLLSIGELTNNKGHDIAIKSLSNMKDRNFTYHIMGHGEDKEKLFKLASNHQMESRVIFHGHVDDASKYISLFDVFYLPSRTEAGSYVTLEALATEVPIITHNVGGLPELLLHEPMTYILDHKNKNYDDDLREAIHLAISAKEERGEHKYSKEEMVRKTKDLYFS